MSAQLVFDLAAAPALGREDFLVSPANGMAVRMLSDRSRWPDRKLLLVGPRASGKSHLSGIWADESGAWRLTGGDLGDETGPAGGPAAVLVDDADLVAGRPVAEALLFHLHNRVLSEGGFLLMTASAPPSAWGLRLPDLLSRMEATSRAVLAPPDDALLAALLVKLFADRQLSVAPNLVSYATSRIDRSFAGARDFVARLDALALATGRPVTRALAAVLLGDGLDSEAQGR